MGSRLKGKENYTYCILGDGEIQEGQVWEAVQAAAHFKLDHLIAFVDNNKKQIDGRIQAICEPFDIEDKFRTFGWNACTVKGYDVEEIYNAINECKTVTDQPSVIVLDTIKGLGVNFAEEVEFNHYLVIDDKMAERGIAEVERRYEAGCYPGGDFKW